MTCDNGSIRTDDMGEDAIIRETFAKLTDEQRDDYLHQMMAYGMAAVHQTSDGAVRVLSQSEIRPALDPLLEGA